LKSIKINFQYIILFCLLVTLSSFEVSGQEKRESELVNVQFVGNQSIPSSQLREVVSSKESPGWFSKFLNSFSGWGEEASFFDSLLIRNDLQDLRNYYWSNGFFESKFESNYDLDYKQNEASLEYYILEGDPAYFRNLTITGLDSLPPVFRYEISIRITIDTTNRYSDALVEENRSMVVNYLRDHGYMLVESVSPLVNIDTSSNRVDVSMEFRSGKRYKINDVRVQKTGEGQGLVTDKLIKEIVGIKPDDYYSYYDLQRAQIRLYRTNLFNSALAAGMIADTNGNYVPINISSEVGLLHEISPEIIVNNEDNAFNLGLGLGFIKKNFFGSARKLTLSTSAAAQNILELLANPSINDTNIFGYADARLGLEQPFL